MLISCEKCSTTYTLDEALIPASGAPVQCTRCSHVFTAYPPRAEPGALDEEPTTGSRRRPATAGPQSRPANQTMVFGTGAVPPQQPPAPAKGSPHQTMVFGTGAPAQPPPAPAKGSPHQTMVFGTGAPAQPPPPAPPPPKPSAHQTMMFGTPAGQQLANQPPPAATPANQTLVFGAGAAQGALPPPAAAAGPRQTVAFGTPAGQQAAAREPAPAQAPANQTLVFGQNQAHAPGGFGTPAGQQLASAQPPSPTARPGTATLVFGAGQQPVPPPAQARPNSTMMFGRPPEAARAPQPTKTMAFGAPVTVKLDAPELETTEGEGEQRESTVRVDLESMMREHGEEAEPGRQERTQRFAMSDVDPSAQAASAGENAQDRHNRTALFAMSTLQETTKPDGKVPVGPTPVSPGPAAKTNPNATAPELDNVSSGSSETFSAQTSDAVTTLPPNALFAQNLSVTDTDPGSDPPGVSTLLEPGFDAKATLRQDQPIASTLPNLPPIGHPATDIAHNPLRLELVSNSDLQGVGTQPERPMLQVDMQSEAAAMQAIASQGRRRTVVAVIIILLLVIAGGLAVLWQLFGKQLLAPRTNPQLQQVVVQALEKLRIEDAQVRAVEVERLESIVKENAGFADGHAALVLALSLQYDDLQAERAVLGVRYDALKKQLEATKDEQKKGDLVKRINQLAARSEDLRQPMTDALNKVDRAVKAMDVAVKTGSPPVQALRARALTMAVRGVAPEASDDADYWVRLSQPLAKLTNPKTSPELLKQALAETHALSADAETGALARPHFVAARLLIAVGDEAKATVELDKALELSANFTAASELKKLLGK